MSYIKREIENSDPATFGPQNPLPVSGQRDIDLDQFLYAVEKEENRILDAEGVWHCNGIYYALAEDASMHRTWEAERRVNERARSMDRWIAQPRRTA